MTWAIWITFTDPFQGLGDWLFMCIIFIGFTVFYYSLVELVCLTALLITIQYLAPFILVDIWMVDHSPYAVYLLIIGVFFVISRVIFYARVRNFLNWDNLSHMNQSLKREVSMHIKTTRALEEIRANLDNQVNRQTKHLRETNQRLSEEIAERRYADKVRTILYRVSTYVNGHHSLEEVLSYIHQQLASVMDVSIFYVGKMTQNNHQITALYDTNAQPNEHSFVVKESLSRLIVHKKQSQLLSREDILGMVQRDEYNLNGIPPISWLGVPLLNESVVIGVLVVQSFKPELTYDKTDQELLEYVSEHLSMAMASNETAAKLIHAKERAEESDRLKSAFLANLSHEIRTPMNAIVGFAELIGQDEITNDERDYFSTQVIDNTQYLLTLISSILELSKIQSGEVQFRTNIQSVNTEITNLVEFAHDKLKTSNKLNLTIGLDIDDEARKLHFLADKHRFSQIMQSLIENAIKFTEEGGIAIGVRRYDRNRIQFSISDTGIGMEMQELKSIFEWFRQGSLASQHLYRGMGLGLTLAKMLVEAMGGEIWVETEKDVGSCFYFTLPASNDIPTIDLTESTIGKESPAGTKQANAG